MNWQYAIYYFILALATITGAIRFKNLSISSRLILLLAILSIPTEIISSYLRTVYANNLIVSRTFPLIEYILIAIAFRVELPDSKKIIDTSIVIAATVIVIDTIANYGFLMQQYPTVQKVVFSILTIGICLLFLLRLLNKETDYSFAEYPLFWISIGWLLYSIITLFNFTAFNYIGKKAPQFAALFTWVRFFANLVLYSLFIAAFLTKQRRLTDS